jgi:radical SAM superfamily enzyme YgiQ (UPF0313 family)
VLIDAIAAKITVQQVMEKIRWHNPQLLIIETSTPSFANDIKIIEQIKNIVPESRIAVCGPHAGVFAEELLQRFTWLDFILIGEYEYTVLELVTCLETRSGLKSVPGLAYRDKESVLVTGPRRSLDNLDSLPWPERKDVPIYAYNDGFAGLPVPNVQMWASRGCPYQCIFCLWPQVMYQEHKYRKRDYVDVADEMEFLVKEYNFKAVYFDDDIFNIDREYVNNICMQIRKRRLNTPWAVMARADLMDEELLKIMADAGLYAVKYGIESANNDVLRRCKKGTDMKKVCSVIQMTSNLGIKIHLTFCLGLPGQTKETVYQTAEFLQKMQPDSFQVSYAVPFPGTEYYRYILQNNQLSSRDWSDYDGGRSCIVSTEGLSKEELKRMHNVFTGNHNS